MAVAETVLSFSSDSEGMPVVAGAPTAANILVNSLSHSATTAATTIITIPAGRTWTGNVAVSCAAANAAAATTAGQARGIIATAGAGATPAGTVMACEAKAGANAATGTVGSQGSNSLAVPLVVIAPAGNSVTVTLASTIAGTAGIVDATASGALI